MIDMKIPTFLKSGQLRLSPANTKLPELLRYGYWSWMLHGYPVPQSHTGCNEINNLLTLVSLYTIICVVITSWSSYRYYV